MFQISLDIAIRSFRTIVGFLIPSTEAGQKLELILMAVDFMHNRRSFSVENQEDKKYYML